MDHLILGTEALGEPTLPPIELEEQFNTAWVSYTWPGTQQKIKAGSDFVIKFARPIDFNEASNDNFIIERVLTEDPLTVSDITDPFETIDNSQDYDSIARELTLHLISPLPYLTNYFFIVRNLVDTTGVPQSNDNIVLFQTSSGGEEIITDNEFDIDQVVIEDYTLISPPLPVGVSSSLVTCSLPDGTLSVPNTTTAITLTYTAAVTVANISVLEENLATGALTVLTPTITQNVSTFVVTITLDNLAAIGETAYYLNENCIYTINAIYTTFQFISSITPFYVPLNHFLPYTTSAQVDPIGWARLVYIMSMEVKARIGVDAASWEVDRLEQIRNYTKYLILAHFEGTGTNDSFMLGELQITSGVKSGVDYKGLLGLWEGYLFGRGRVTQSVDLFWPRPGRAGVDPYRSQVSREWKTFDRRLD
jgi:hypothetical protein